MNQIEFALHRIREQEIEELRKKLGQPEITKAMVESILNRSVEVCVDAYTRQDEEIGDAFAALNGEAEERWHQIPAA